MKLIYNLSTNNTTAVDFNLLYFNTKCFFQQIQQNGEKKSFGQKAVRATAAAAQQATGWTILSENNFWPPYAYVEKATYDLKNVSENFKRKKVLKSFFILNWEHFIFKLNCTSRGWGPWCFFHNSLHFTTSWTHKQDFWLIFILPFVFRLKKPEK